jgi:secreted trypsin-like serine protease
MLGWGFTCQGEAPECADPNPSILQQLDSAVAEPSACAPKAHLDAAREWCVKPSADGGQACYGDSGGPLIIWGVDQWLLIGATSRDGDANRDCADGYGIWSSVPAHAAWIRDVT